MNRRQTHEQAFPRRRDPNNDRVLGKVLASLAPTEASEGHLAFLPTFFAEPEKFDKDFFGMEVQ